MLHKICIIKIVATRCQILRLKGAQIDFSCGSLQHSADLLAGIIRLVREREGYKKENGRREGEARGTEEEGRGESGGNPVCIKFSLD